MGFTLRAEMLGDGRQGYVVWLTNRLTNCYNRSKQVVSGNHVTIIRTIDFRAMIDNSIQTKKDILTIIRRHLDKIKSFGVKKLGLFGSFVTHDMHVIGS